MKKPSSVTTRTFADNHKIQTRKKAGLVALGLLLSLGACSDGEEGLNNDINPASGGAVGSGGHGGPNPGSGGSDGTGGNGEPSTGGASDGSGGRAEGSGGEASSAGGMTGGDPGTGGDGSGGMSAEGCQKGTTQGSEVLFIGESFVAASSIPEETSKLARAAGSLEANDSYQSEAISGTWIGNGAGNSIPNQYNNNSDGVRFVLMNGGGNDCWQGGQESDRQNALNAAAQLFDDMDANGVEKIVYFFYPDPIGGQFADLTACLDLLRPEMKKLCDEQGSPKCYWVDLRDTWEGHPEYTSDGIHVAAPGNAPTAGAIFEAMEQNCVAP